ncbi:hypothetical protein HZS_3731 [Henneguya salminicola]|nr:hypothetical protein HZS_3731 [Henneguya salminicola]
MLNSSEELIIRLNDIIKDSMINFQPPNPNLAAFTQIYTRIISLSRRKMLRNSTKCLGNKTLFSFDFLVILDFW